MGYGDFGIFRDGSSKTPNLDKLAKEGMCLTQHYSASVVCAPARASFMTGRYSHRTGAIDTQDANGTNRLSLKETTMGDIFKKAGYKTGLVGKWHLGAFDERYHPNSRGFEYFTGFCGGWSDYYDYYMDYNGELLKSDGQYITDVITKETINFIRNNKDNPFLLHVAYSAPHFPFQAPKEDIEIFERTGEYTKKLSTLYAMIYRMDKGIGRILYELKSLGIRDNTLVIFVSDNGPQLGGDLNRYNYSLKGEKGLVYEGGIRVPGILSLPGLFEGGSFKLLRYLVWNSR